MFLHRRITWLGAFVGVIALSAWNCGLIANVMLTTLTAQDLRPRDHVRPQAIVLLGGRTDRTLKALEIRKNTQLPLFVSGSDVLAALLAAGVTPEWVDIKSSNTETNAAAAACTLGQQGIRSVILVTDDWHMPRARLWFRYYGFEVVPASSPITTLAPLQHWWQTARGWTLQERKNEALHEWTGVAGFWMLRLLRHKHACVS